MSAVATLTLSLAFLSRSADVGWLTISRFILLDSMLLLFTFTTALGLVNFHNMQDESVLPRARTADVSHPR